MNNELGARKENNFFFGSFYFCVGFGVLVRLYILIATELCFKCSLGNSLLTCGFINTQNP